MGEPYNRYFDKRRKMSSDTRDDLGSQFDHEYSKFNNQDYYKLKAEHTLKGKLFEDPTFSADCALINQPVHSIIVDEEITSSSNHFQCESSTTEWLRPHVSFLILELCTKSSRYLTIYVNCF